MIGQTLLGQEQPFVNPFLQGNSDNPDSGMTTSNYGAMGPSAPQTGPGAASPPAAEGNHPWKNYVQGWKNLMGNFKTDPNMRVAMFQTLLSMTQPDSTPAAAIGRGLNAGVGTLQALRQQQVTQKDKEFQQGLEKKKVGIEQQQADTGTSGVAQRANEAQMANARGEQQIGVDQGNLKENARHNKEQEAIEREKIANGGEAGPVMKQWNELTGLVQQLNPGLTSAQAKATAWDIKQSAGKMPRSQLKAQIMAQNAIMLPTRQRGEDDQTFAKRVQAAVHQQSDQMDEILNAAGYENPTSFGQMPGMQPLPQPKTAAERDALTPGQNYLAPDGTIKVR